MVWKMLRETRGADAPTHIAVVFDKSEVTFRNELYSEPTRRSARRRPTTSCRSSG